MDFLAIRSKIISDFDNNYSKELSLLEKDINLITNLYSLLFFKNPKYFFEDKTEYIILILRSIEYLISAIHLVKQRAMTEACNIVRLTIETSSVAIHIHSNKEILRKYKQNKYKSTSAITYANEHIKTLGKLWGELSEVMVHPNTFHGIKTVLEGNRIIETGEVNFGFKEKNELMDKNMILLLRITSNIILKSFEVIVSVKAHYKEIEGLYFKEFGLFAINEPTDIKIERLILEFINNNAQQAPVQPRL